MLLRRGSASRPSHSRPSHTSRGTTSRPRQSTAREKAQLESGVAQFDRAARALDDARTLHGASHAEVASARPLVRAAVACEADVALEWQ